MKTPLTSEALVTHFKFWSDDQIQKGIRFGNELFRYCASFQSHQRQQAFDLACHLSQQEMEVVITAGSTCYIVWVSLRSRDSSDLEPYDPESIQAKKLELEQALQKPFIFASLERSLWQIIIKIRRRLMLGSPQPQATKSEKCSASTTIS